MDSHVDETQTVLRGRVAIVTGAGGEAADMVAREIADTGAEALAFAASVSEQMLERLSPGMVSPGLLALVCDDTPTRAILCGGSGHLARSDVTLTNGVHLGGDEAAPRRAVANWARVSDRTDGIVPDYGFAQMEHEMACALGAPLAKAVGG